MRKIEYGTPEVYEDELFKIRVRKPILTETEKARRQKILERAVENIMRPIVFPDRDLKKAMDS